MQATVQEPKKMVDPPPNNAFRSKWANLFVFLLLDFTQIIFISLLIPGIKESETSWVGFDYVPNSSIVWFTVGSVVVVYLLRSITGSYQILQLFTKPGIFQLYPADITEETLQLDYLSPSKIIKTVKEVAEEMKISPVSKIFMAKTAVPNAYTIVLSEFPFIPFIRKRNYVVLNSNIMQILNEEEIRAVIAHELGHIRNHDSIIRLILSAPHLFLQIAYLLLYIRILTGVSNAILVQFNPVIAAVRTLDLFVVMILATLISDWSIGFLRKSNQMAELQADLESLRIVGFKPTINMLIKLGQRTEVLERLKGEMFWLEKQDLYRQEVRKGLIIEILEQFSQTEIDDQKVRQEAPRVYLEKILDSLAEAYKLELRDLPGVEERLVRAVAALQKKRARELELLTLKQQNSKKPDLGVIDWRDFDLNRAQSLEEQEIRQFVSHLQVSPNMLFRSEVADLKNPERTHPSFRTRVLFVNHVCLEWSTKSNGTNPTI